MPRPVYRHGHSGGVRWRWLPKWQIQRGNPPHPTRALPKRVKFVPFDVERGYDIIDVLKVVGARHGASPARVAIAWAMAQPMISSVIIAARTLEHLDDNIQASDLKLTDEDMHDLHVVSDPGVPYPRWMVLQLDQAEDPRPKVLEPNALPKAAWKDLRDTV
ncbi:MAG: aldo/keto reductase [Anaerolineae bacterium]